MIKLLFAALLSLCASLPLRAQTPVQPAEAPEAIRILVMLHLPPPHFRPDASYSGRYPDDGARAARHRIAAQLASTHQLTLVSDWAMPVIGIDCYVMQLPPHVSLAQALALLAHDSRVAWAQPLHDFQAMQGADPLFPVQPVARYWRLAELHKTSTGRAVRVAVIDSGIDGQHPDLAGQIALRANFVDATPDAAEVHGTAVAAIIAARRGNGQGITGIAPEARLLALRACWPDAASPATRCNSFTLGKALNFAILNHAKIINMSLSGPSDRLLETLLDAATERGITIVGAVDPQRADGGFPASHPGVLAVSMAGGTRSTAPAILTAPGQDIPSAAPGARWAFVSGSSYAAAHVSALAALAFQLQPAASSAQLRAAIQAGDGSDRQAGNIDACATLARFTGACTCSCPPLAATALAKP